MSKRKLLHRRGESSIGGYSTEPSTSSSEAASHGGGETMMSSMMNHRNNNGHSKKGLSSRMFAPPQVAMENEAAATASSFHSEDGVSYPDPNGRMGKDGGGAGGVADALSSLAAAAEGMANLAQRGRKTPAQEENNNDHNHEARNNSQPVRLGATEDYRLRRSSYDSQNSSGQKKRNKVKRERDISHGSSKSGSNDFRSGVNPDGSRGVEDRSMGAPSAADDNDDDDAPWGRSIAAESSLAQRMSGVKEPTMVTPTMTTVTEETGTESRAATPQPSAQPPSTPPSGSLDEKQKIKQKKKKKKKRELAQIAGSPVGDDGMVERRANYMDDDNSTVDHAAPHGRGVEQPQQQEMEAGGDLYQEQRKKTKKKKKVKKELPADAAESLLHYQHHAAEAAHSATQQHHAHDEYMQQQHHPSAHDNHAWSEGGAAAPRTRSPQPPPSEPLDSPSFNARPHPQNSEEANHHEDVPPDPKIASKKRRMMKKNFAKRAAEDSKHASSTSSPPPPPPPAPAPDNAAAQEHVLAALASAATAVKEREDLKQQQQQRQNQSGTAELPSEGARAPAPPQDLYPSRSPPPKSPPRALAASLESRSVQLPPRASPDSDESLHTTASTAEPPKQPFKKKRKKSKQLEGSSRPTSPTPPQRAVVDRVKEGARTEDGHALQQHSPKTSASRELTEPPMRPTGVSEESMSALPQTDEKDLQRMAASPFVMDYAVGLALRYQVLLPVLDDVTAVEAAAQSDRIPYTLGDVVTAGRLLGLFHRGENVYLRATPSLPSDHQTPPTLEKAHYRSAVVTRKLRDLTRRSVIRARIEPATIADARLLSSWYASEGDKVLPYTSMDWSNWWMYRCAMPEPGCEMVKLVAVPFKNGEGQAQQQEGIVLGFAYLERHLNNHHPHAQSGGSSDASGDKSVFSTLIHAMRILPHINPTVLKRLSLSRRLPPEFYDLSHAVVDALVSHVCFRSLLFGSAVVGVLAEKDDATESLYESHFGRPLLMEEGDGRLYFGLEIDHRWDRLRRAFSQQLTLRSEWDRGAPVAAARQQAHEARQLHQRRRRLDESAAAGAMMAALGEAAVMAAASKSKNGNAAAVVTPESSEESV